MVIFWVVISLLAVIMLFFIAVALSSIHDLLKAILQRWAALDNLGMFNGAFDHLDENQQWRTKDERRG